MSDPGDSIPNGAAAVSFPGEELILVDSDDQVVGHASKQAVHRGRGLRHRAFSVFLFDDRQRLLIHRRSMHKPLWHGFWTNSCCSHPRRGEVLENSVRRRLREELTCEVARLERVCAFEYHAAFGDAGSEHELCHIYLAQLAPGAQVLGHELEIAELDWVSPDAVDAMMATKERRDLTPWFREEWALLRGAYADRFGAFLATPVAEPVAEPVDGRAAADAAHQAPQARQFAPAVAR